MFVDYVDPSFELAVPEANRTVKGILSAEKKDIEINMMVSSTSNRAQLNSYSYCLVRFQLQGILTS